MNDLFFFISPSTANCAEDETHKKLLSGNAERLLLFIYCCFFLKLFVVMANAYNSHRPLIRLFYAFLRAYLKYYNIAFKLLVEHF